MKLKESKKLIQPFIDQCKKDNDCYMVVHFSRGEDTFCGLTRMDTGDALIIINKLIQQYKLSPEAVCKANES